MRVIKSIFLGPEVIKIGFCQGITELFLKRTNQNSSVEAHNDHDVKLIWLHLKVSLGMSQSLCGILKRYNHHCLYCHITCENSFYLL